MDRETADARSASSETGLAASRLLTIPRVRLRMPILGVLAAVVGIGSGCGNEEFTQAQQVEIRDACVERFEASYRAVAPGRAGLRRFCERSIRALAGEDAGDFRRDPSAFLEEHLSHATIARCS
jgi:hypothetical protein